MGLGGRVAEQIVFGSVTTGAPNDLRRSDEISRAMVAEYGMGNSMSSRRLAIDDYSISDNTRRLVDEEQAGHHRRRLPPRPQPDRHQPRPARRARRGLLEQEVIERGDIERIVREHREGRLTAVPDEPEVIEGGVVRELEPGVPRLAAAERYDGETTDRSRRTPSPSS